MRNRDICPDCEEEMENGYIVGGTTLFWSDKKPKRGIARSVGNFKLDTSFWGFAKVRAKLCVSCELRIYRHDKQ